MTSRAQANLIGFAVAVVVVTTVTVAGMALANDALVDADRDPATAHAADDLAAYLVDADAAHARGPNVVSSAAVRNLTASDLEAAVPSLRGRSIRITLGGDVLVERSAPAASGDGRRARDAGFERVERRVRVEHTVQNTERIELSERREVTLADHTGDVTVAVDPRRGRSVTTVRAGNRVVLHDPSGLAGEYSVAVPDAYPLVLAFDADGPYVAGAATVAWHTRNASVERLVVSVGA
ncbi:hypothetical protein [Halobellus sp. Atlit-38R]|uniref:DUF7263 family protein n=1 Tax=Halobellus sp. Atlit-38R TaxID=2282131 RepID=UPI0011C466E8|nr:hypothetical protein [Halobellus sp. Atlit-38R]